METISRATSNLDPWYVTGFLEADCSFTYNRSGMEGKNLVLVFAVKRPQADRALLEELQDFFGVGRIYEARPASLYYRVSHRDELDLLLAHFDVYPMRGAKQKTYLLWREMVLLRKHHFRKPPLERLDALAKQLSLWGGAAPDPSLEPSTPPSPQRRPPGDAVPATSPPSPQESPRESPTTPRANLRAETPESPALTPQEHLVGLV
jgi:hypothetical protein